MKLLTQAFLVFLITGKIVLGSILMYQIELVPFSVESSAIASEPKKDTEVAAEKQKNWVNEEEIDVNLLIKKSAELKEQEEKIAKRKAELIAMEEGINQKIELLTRLRNEIRAEMARKKASADQKLKHLIKAYSAMKPQKAAALIEKLEADFAIQLLANMKGEAVGSILTFINIEKAAKISKGLVKRP